MLEIDQGAGKVLRHEARRFFGDIPNIANAINEVRANSEQYNARIAEFHRVLGDFADIQIYREDPGERFLHAKRFTGLRFPPTEVFPSLSWVMAEYSFSKNAKTSLAAKETFRDIQGKIRDGEWKFPAQVTNSNVLTSALLIEGYGLFIEKLTGEEGMARTFVLGFEEMLWNRFRDSEILKDVLPWMIEERDEFSPKMRDELAEFAQA